MGIVACSLAVLVRAHTTCDALSYNFVVTVHCVSLRTGKYFRSTNSKYATATQNQVGNIIRQCAAALYRTLECVFIRPNLIRATLRRSEYETQKERERERERLQK
jgi:hypothetical protein